MRILWVIWDIFSFVLDNMFNRRWWYLWAFQFVFLMILLERNILEPKNSPLYIMMMIWTTLAIILLNLEASYSDYTRKTLKKYIDVIGSKSTMGDTSAD